MIRLGNLIPKQLIQYGNYTILYIQRHDSYPCYIKNFLLPRSYFHPFKYLKGILSDSGVIWALPQGLQELFNTLRIYQFYCMVQGLYSSSATWIALRFKITLTHFIHLSNFMSALYLCNF